MSRLLVCLENRCAEAFVRNALDGRGFDVTIASSANEMLRIVRGADFNQILMDANFYGMSAITAIRILRDMGSQAEVIIGSTEDGDLMQQLFLTSVGADEVLPFRKAVGFLAARGKPLPPVIGNVVAFRPHAIH